MDKATYIQKYIANQREQKDIASLKYLLADKHGRWFLSRIFSYCKMRATLFKPSIEKILINEGHRRVAITTYNAVKKLDAKRLDLAEIEYTAMPFKFITKHYKDLKAIKYLLNNDCGRWYLARLFDRCHLTTTTFDIEKSNNVLVSKGEREIADIVINMIACIGIKGIVLKQKAQQEYTDWQERMQQLADESQNKEDEY